MSTSDALRRDLRRLGYSRTAIDAAWPEWWGREAEESVSATTELRFTVARRLGLSPRSLFDDEPRFVWKDQTRYKNLGAHDAEELAALSAFGVAIARPLAAGAGPSGLPSLAGAAPLRQAILERSPQVDLVQLLVVCWTLGVPVAYLTVFPLPQKRMHAMSVRVQGRYVVLLGRSSSYHAQLAYTIAHELGHIFLGHLRGDRVLVEADDPLHVAARDEEETAADRFALELLTGNPEPMVISTEPDFNAVQLAESAQRHGPEYRIDPGVLALCLGHATGRWPQVMSALRTIPPGREDLVARVNELADQQVQWAELPDASVTYIRRILGLPA